MTERRYSDEEVRRILELATSRRGLPAGGAPAATTGLTLREIQGIAGEVGIDAGDVARAAVALDSRPAATVGRSLGMPNAVGRVIPLPRNLTDHEWERLVAELRRTFGATGRVTVVGGLREWSNSKLRACVEPAGSGYHLRIHTEKSGARDINTLGAGAIGVGTLLFTGTMIAGNPEIAAPIILGSGGMVVMLLNALRLPGWASARQRQMDQIAERLPHLLDERASSDA